MHQPLVDLFGMPLDDAPPRLVVPQLAQVPTQPALDLVPYTRPRNSTANPNWFNAATAVDLVPVFDDTSGDQAKFVRMCGNFTLTQGPMAGQPFGSALLPWQDAFLRAFFTCRESLLMIGKGSGKSVTAAAIAVAYVMWSYVHGINTRGLVAVLASSLATAKIIWDHVYEGVLADAELAEQFKPNIQSRTLTHKPTGIDITILAPSLEQAVGRRPVLLLIDELHELAKLREATQICNQLRQGGRNWGEAFKVLTISTMAVEKPVGEFRRLLAYARGVRDGTIVDPHFLPVLFEFPVLQRPELDPGNPAEWWRGMPSLRTDHQPGTMDAGELLLELQTAANASDGEQLEMSLSQRLGIERNLRSDGAESVLHGAWGQLPTSPPPFAQATACAISIDPGGTDDPFAVATILALDDGRVHISCHQYLVTDGHQRAPGHLRELYDEAKRNGTMSVYDRFADMEAAIFRDVLTITRALRITPTYGGDPAGLAGFVSRFENIVGPYVSAPQRDFMMAAALAQFESLLNDHLVSISPCPLLTANVHNLRIEDHDNTRRLRKKDSPTTGFRGAMKIDGIMAVITGIKLLAEVPQLDVSLMVG